VAVQAGVTRLSELGESDAGFGVALELEASPRAVLRLDAGDQMLKYPGPVLSADREARQDGFWDHNLRVMLGLGLRF
jgi:hypothetical protein